MKDNVQVVNAAIIKNNRILLVGKKYENDKEYLILPGGKKESEENDLECLAREVGEELSGAKIKIDPRPYKFFKGTTPSYKKASVKVYFAGLINGGEIKPSKEITSVMWAEYNPAINQRNLSDITRDILSSLNEDGYLK